MPEKGRLRILFCGTPQFAVPTLKHLLAQEDFEIIAVTTQPDRPSGRGMQASFSPVKETALAAGVPAYVIFHDATLTAIAAARPKSLNDLLRVSGVGESKLRKYGDELLEVLRTP